MNAKQLENAEAANRLHHLSMRYVGAMIEAATGESVVLIPSGHPGLRECRDLIDLILLCRAEINALSKLLLDKGVCSADEMFPTMTAEYDWLREQKEQFLGVGTTDAGLVLRPGDAPADVREDPPARMS